MAHAKQRGEKQHAVACNSALKKWKCLILDGEFCAACWLVSLPYDHDGENSCTGAVMGWKQNSVFRLFKASFDLPPKHCYFCGFWQVIILVINCTGTILTVVYSRTPRFTMSVQRRRARSRRLESRICSDICFGQYGWTTQSDQLSQRLSNLTATHGPP